MRNTTKTMFAFVVASLMILSACAICFAGDESSGAQTPQRTTGTVKVLKTDSGISLELPTDNDGKQITGITTNGVDTVTIEGAYYQTTVDTDTFKDTAFYVGPGISLLKIVISSDAKQEKNNLIICKNTSGPATCMIFESPVKIIGKDGRTDSIALNCNSGKGIGIDKKENLTVENVKVNIGLRSNGNTNDEAYGITDKGRLDIDNANVAVNCSGNKGDFYGLTVDTSNKSSIVIDGYSNLVEHMVGVTINEWVKESTISTIISNVNGAGNYSIGIKASSPDAKITDSLVKQQFKTGYSNEGALSFGFYMKEIGPSPVFDNCVVTLCGNDGVACHGSLDDLQPFDVSSLFSANTIVRGSTNTGIVTDYPTLIEGKIGFEYKNIETTLKHHVIYDLNGAEGTAPTDYVEAGEEFVVKDINVTRNGYTFGGWTDGDNIYMPGTVLTMGTLHDVELKAVWNESHSDSAPTLAICALFALLLVVGVVFYFGRRAS